MLEPSEAAMTEEPSEAAMREAREPAHTLMILLNLWGERCPPDMHGSLCTKISAEIALALDRHAAAQRETLQAVMQWAEARCPCSNEQPDPCPLCGASVNGRGPDAVCRAADYTFPKHLLDKIAAASRSAS